jgi:hypothetical protein
VIQKPDDSVGYMFCVGWLARANVCNSQFVDAGLRHGALPFARAHETKDTRPVQRGTHVGSVSQHATSCQAGRFWQAEIPVVFLFPALTGRTLCSLTASPRAEALPRLGASGWVTITSNHKQPRRKPSGRTHLRKQDRTNSRERFSPPEWPPDFSNDFLVSGRNRGRANANEKL